MIQNETWRVNASISENLWTIEDLIMRKNMLDELKKYLYPVPDLSALLDAEGRFIQHAVDEWISCPDKPQFRVLFKYASKETLLRLYSQKVGSVKGGYLYQFLIVNRKDVVNEIGLLDNPPVWSVGGWYVHFDRAAQLNISKNIR